MLKRIPSRAGPKRVIYPSIMEAKSSTVATVAAKPLVGKKASTKSTKITTSKIAASKSAAAKAGSLAMIRVKDVCAQNKDMEFEFIAKGMVRNGVWWEMRSLVLWDKACPDQDEAAQRIAARGCFRNDVAQRMCLPISVPAGTRLVKAMEPTMAMFDNHDHPDGMRDWQSKCVVGLRYNETVVLELSRGRVTLL